MNFFTKHAAWVGCLLCAFSTLLSAVVVIGAVSDRTTVWTDPDTGCEYLVRGNTLTPRIDSASLFAPYVKGCHL